MACFDKTGTLTTTFIGIYGFIASKNKEFEEL